jgi:hypothetical protein
MEQQEQVQQQELDQQGQLQNPEKSHAVVQPSTSGIISPPPTVPERDPDHHAPAVLPEPTTQAQVPTQFIPVGTVQPQLHETADRGLTTPSTANTSFLDDSEVGAAVPASGKTINGGPVPVELIQTAEAQAHPGVNRTNTDISVSDLHVPGEYPKISEGKIPLR